MTPVTQDEWTIHALNIHGVFFERRCASIVAETSGWKVLSTNYPVEFPPSNGILRGKDSSLDIWARRQSDPSVVVDVFIECKKANPSFVNWVFFPKQVPTPIRFTRAFNAVTAGGGPWTCGLKLVDTAVDFAIANDAREVRGDYAKHRGGDKTKTSNTAIQEAAYQVALAMKAVVHEEQVLLGRARESAAHPAPPWLSKTYVPVIVTTANLSLVNFSPSATDLASGEIGFKDGAFTPVECILYEYALPKHLQFAPTDPLRVLQRGDSEEFSRLSIMVVHSGHLSRLLCGMFPSEGSVTNPRL